MLAFFMMAKYAIILIRFSRGVAQLVEHWSPKPGVASSSLAAPAINRYTKKPIQIRRFLFVSRFRYF